MSVNKTASERIASWYRLDNAAKLFPAILSNKDSGVFRISATLYEPVDPDVLLQAVKDCKPRFPSMYVKIRQGLFWFYFEPNEKDPIVKQESSRINEIIDLTLNNNYLFTFFYYDDRISLESFHSLCDGTGALSFLKAVVYRYLERLNVPLADTEDVLKIDQAPSREEMEDSFLKYYVKHAEVEKKIPRAYHIRELHYPHYYDVGILNGKVNTKALLQLAKSKEATVTQYLSAALTYAIYCAYKETAIHRPINILVPINARKLFKSQTLRNFAIPFYTSVDFKDRELSFDVVLLKIKQDFIEAVRPDWILKMIGKNVSFERNIFIRLAPLFMKKIGIRIGSFILGDVLSTTTLSNLGEVRLSQNMSESIKELAFTLSCNYAKTNKMGVISYNGITTISITRTIYKTSLERCFFSFLANQGLDVTLESNLIENAIRGPENVVL